MPKTKPVLPKPEVILFDWHGTLVDTQDAMFGAMEKMLPLLEDLKLVERLQQEKLCRSHDDVKLVRYIRIFRRLHPKILAERRVSRTDIFNAIFGDDIEAKNIAHKAYNTCYRDYFGKVQPFQEGVGHYLKTLNQLGIALGVATNRSREFLEKELQLVDNGAWQSLLQTTACADDVTHYKPHPEVINAALSNLNCNAQINSRVWYVGDSYLDMITARNAGLTAVFYNGACWDKSYIEQLFRHEPEAYPDAIIDNFNELIDLLEYIENETPNVFNRRIVEVRPPEYEPPHPPAHHIEPDWHPSVAQLTPPTTILFDWHATLVDTLDAMYHAVDDMLPELKAKGLLSRMVEPNKSKTPEDAKLVEYVQNYAKLHPKVKADRKISRTDIFEVLFGSDQEAKQQAHKIFTAHYRNHFGTVLPFEPQVKNMLIGLRALGLKVGVITNRDREFFEHELAAVETTGWTELFDVNICGDDTPLRKPHPDQLVKATDQLGLHSQSDVWYVGDSTTDTIAAKRAGQTSVFFNGAQWDLPWLERIFPGTEFHPHKPDVVVNDFSEFWALVLACLEQ
ncbi:MAG: HAD-IA family hydrolase [Pseudomonadales bacterium]|nr:HAD-IA family hydrolase [Pseudomonadales bacterium]